MIRTDLGIQLNLDPVEATWVARILAELVEGGLGGDHEILKAAPPTEVEEDDRDLWLDHLNELRAERRPPLENWIDQLRISPDKPLLIKEEELDAWIVSLNEIRLVLASQRTWLDEEPDVEALLEKEKEMRDFQTVQMLGILLEQSLSLMVPDDIGIDIDWDQETS